MAKFCILVYRFILVFCFFTTQLGALDCVVSLVQESGLTCIDDYIPETLYIKKITCHADSTCDIGHVTSLIGLIQEHMYTRDDVKKALFYCLKTKKFDSARVRCTPIDGGYALDFDFSVRWIYSRIVFEGSFIGKDRYRNYYLLAAGDVFDKDMHDQSLRAMRSALREEGYFNAVITDSIIPDAATKLITVRLSIVLGPRFVIRGVLSCIEDHDALEKKITKKLAYLKGQSYSKPLLDKAAQELKRYLISKGYYTSTINCETEFFGDTAQVKVFFTIKCGHRTSFEFLGNHFFSKDELFNVIKLFSTSEMLVPPAILADEIKSLYIKKGFFDVSVILQEEQDSKTSPVVFFCINEGHQFKVTVVRVTGAVHDFFLAGLNTFYDAEQWDKYKEALIDAYIQKGFWDITCTQHECKKTGPGICTPELTFVPGKQRLLVGITVELFPDVLQEPLFAPYCALKGPVPFSLYLIQEQQRWFNTYFQKKGLLYLLARPELRDTPDGVWLNWKMVGEREPVHFGKTIIIGNSLLDSSYLVRELSFKEGDIWNKDALNRSLKNLKNLGVFESISLYPCDFAEKNKIKDLYLKVIEDSKFELRTRAGLLFISRNFGIRGGFSYMAGGSLVWKNPTNRADLARIDIDMSRYKHGIRGLYIQPWFLNMPIKTEYKLYSNRYDQPFVIGSRDRLYRLAQNGFLIGWSRGVNYWQTGLTVGTEWMRINKLSTSLARAIDFEPHLIDTWIPYCFAEPSFFLEYLDNKLQPTSGFMSMLSAKVMIPYTLSQAFFFKVLLEQSCFVPLYTTVFAFRLRAGHLFNQQFSRIMPNERFYLGGAYSLRGYPPDLAPPLNIYDCNGCRHFVPLGGRSMINMNFEVRFPVYGSFSGVVFSDWGALAQKHPSELVAGVIGANGFGFRYNTPVGPLRFDIGWKWKRQPGECAYAWFLTLGNAF